MRSIIKTIIIKNRVKVEKTTFLDSDGAIAGSDIVASCSYFGHPIRVQSIMSCPNMVHQRVWKKKERNQFDVKNY